MDATVVLADDDDDLRAVYTPCLQAAGYTVWEAADGHQALDQVRRHRPDLLLLDLWMPGLNGFEVLDRLRYEPAAAHLKVVMFS
ncbi:MAG TPA: response regulator, partial [Isosphaeraceae bacterium]